MRAQVGLSACFKTLTFQTELDGPFSVREELTALGAAEGESVGFGVGAVGAAIGA